MARIHEEHIVIKISKIAPQDGDVASVITDEMVAALQEVAQHLIAESTTDQVVVEADKA